MRNISLGVKDGCGWFGYAGFEGPIEHLYGEGPVTVYLTRHTVRNL